eukprot:366448-Chlamydomonas_euryale.AAC.6
MRMFIGSVGAAGMEAPPLADEGLENEGDVCGGGGLVMSVTSAASRTKRDGARHPHGGGQLLWRKTASTLNERALASLRSFGLILASCLVPRLWLDGGRGRPCGLGMEELDFCVNCV